MIRTVEELLEVVREKGVGGGFVATRGQPPEEAHAQSNKMLTCVGVEDCLQEVALPGGTSKTVDIRNYTGPELVAGLPIAREFFGAWLGATLLQTLVWGPSSLELIEKVLCKLILRGVRDGAQPRLAPLKGKKPKFIVVGPGYDRHITLLRALGFDLVMVPMLDDGPDMEMVEGMVKEDDTIVGMIIVPNYSNPTGTVYSEEAIRRLASMETAFADFRIVSDNAYCIHKLRGELNPPRLVRACADAGNADRVLEFGSTSKVTFSGAGIAFMASSEENIAWLAKLFGEGCIGPNKIEQLRHVKFLSSVDGGIEGHMERLAAILQPRFQACYDVLAEALTRLDDEGTSVFDFEEVDGGYFFTVRTLPGLAMRVAQILAEELNVVFTDPKTLFPDGDPEDRYLRICPSRLSVAENRTIMMRLVLAIELARAEQKAVA